MKSVMTGGHNVGMGRKTYKVFEVYVVRASFDRGILYPHRLLGYYATTTTHHLGTMKRTSKPFGSLWSV